MRTNQKGFSNIILGVAIVVILAGVVGYFVLTRKAEPITQQPVPTPITQQPVPAPNQTKTTNQTPTPTPVDETANWKTYRNEKYGFEFKYPPNSTVAPRQDLNYQNIELYNYSTTDDRMSLAAGEYYLEIYIFDQKLGHKSSESCQQSIVNPKKVELGVVTGYRGYGEAGDYAGVRFALCAERPEVYFYIGGTENNEKAPLINSIFDSFKFIH